MNKVSQITTDYKSLYLRTIKYYLKIFNNRDINLSEVNQMKCLNQLFNKPIKKKILR